MLAPLVHLDRPIEAQAFAAHREERHRQCLARLALARRDGRARRAKPSARLSTSRLTTLRSPASRVAVPAGRPPLVPEEPGAAGEQQDDADDGGDDRSPWAFSSPPLAWCRCHARVSTPSCSWSVKLAGTLAIGQGAWTMSDRHATDLEASETRLQAALDALAAADPDVARAIERVGRPASRRRPPGFRDASAHHHGPAAVHQGGGRHSRPARGGAGRWRHAERLPRPRRCLPARLRAECAQGRVRPASGIGHRRAAGSISMRSRQLDDEAVIEALTGAARLRPLECRDLPPVRAGPARCPAGRRSGAADRLSSGSSGSTSGRAPRRFAPWPRAGHRGAVPARSCSGTSTGRRRSTHA